MDMKIILGILLTSIFSKNFALIERLGTGAVLENERSSRRSLTLGLGTTMVMVLSTLITWPLNKYVLEKVPYMQTMAFVLVVLIVVEIIHLIAKNVLDTYCKSNFVKFAINGAVLGLCIENAHADLTTALVTSAAMGIGFMLTMTVYAKIKNTLIDEEAVPPTFRGLPIDLLTAGMMVLALLALNFKF